MSSGSEEPRPVPDTIEPEKRVGRDCWFDGCTRTVDAGPLWRVNPKGERGIFMCSEHAALVDAPPKEPR